MASSLCSALETNRGSRKMGGNYAENRSSLYRFIPLESCRENPQETAEKPKIEIGRIRKVSRLHMDVDNLDRCEERKTPPSAKICPNREKNFPAFGSSR